MKTKTSNPTPEITPDVLDLSYIAEQLRALAVPVETLKLDPENARAHDERNRETVHGSLKEYGQRIPVVVNRNTMVIEKGNLTYEETCALGRSHIAAVLVDDDDTTAKGFAIVDNRSGELAKWNLDVLRIQLDELELANINIDGLGFNTSELADLFDAAKDGAAAIKDAKERKTPEQARKTLAERFVVPPFSVLDSRQGYWQDRKSSWLALGIRSHEGRDEKLLMSESSRPPRFYELKNEMRDALGREPKWEEVNAEAQRLGISMVGMEGTSIFDPVVCELAYRWFCPESGRILDPFAGGSVRGLVAAKLNRQYVGVDLRPEQVEANQSNWAAFEPNCLQGNHQQANNSPVWKVGDSTRIDDVLEEAEPFDFLFSCPPYADLEKYSDDPADLSNMSYDEFVDAYARIIKLSVDRLADDRFACFVVGDIRDKKGIYRGFVSDTIAAFEEAGARFYNDGVLITQVSSAAVRAGRVFEAGRKLCKVHQNVLVFVKGDWKKATEAVGSCDFGSLDLAEQFGEVVA